MWRMIAMYRPDITFYFYTKTARVFDFSGLLALNNVSMINSVLPCGRKNYGKHDYIDSMKKEYPQAFVCGYGMENAPRCGIDCTYCMTASHDEKIVLFLDHSGIDENKPKKASKAKKNAAAINHKARAAVARAAAWIKEHVA